MFSLSLQSLELVYPVYIFINVALFLNYMLYLIGLGLGDEKDITVRGLEAVKKCSKLYLDCYTSRLSDADFDDLEKFYDKKIIAAERELIEKDLI